MFKPLPTRALLGAAILAMASLHASAALVTSRGALGATGGLDWAQLGIDGASVTTPVNNASTSIASLSATITNPGGLGPLTRFDEGLETWAGNFATGDALLTTFEGGGAIRIDFSAAISRVGAQMQGLNYAAFSGLISVYDAMNALLETFTVVDDSVDDAADNSAMFLGISRGTADIDHVVFDVTGTDPLIFGINQLSLSQEVDTTPPGVPEPGTLALVALSLASLAVAKRRASR